MPIRITVELIPHGDENQKQKLAIIDVENDGTGTHEKGNYIVRAEGQCYVGGENVGWDGYAGFPKRITVRRGRGSYFELAKEAMRVL
jgi:hypothetical protein